MKKTERLMAISGLLGFSFFLIANFTSIFLSLNILSGVIQILLNVFVFITWLEGYRTSNGFKKFVAFWGVVVPAIMAGITFVRVIIPALFI